MSKLKAGFIAAVITILTGGFLYSLHANNVWSYYTAIQFFGWYGVFRAGLSTYEWIIKPEDPKAPKTYMDWATEYENKH
jgi:hypothetical protein